MTPSRDLKNKPVNQRGRVTDPAAQSEGFIVSSEVQRASARKFLVPHDLKYFPPGLPAHCSGSAEYQRDLLVAKAGVKCG